MSGWSGRQGENAEHRHGQEVQEHSRLSRFSRLRRTLYLDFAANKWTKKKISWDNMYCLGVRTENISQIRHLGFPKIVPLY